jgi:host factor-I protein
MQKSSPNIQDSFLNQVRKDRMILTVHLVDGTELKGKVSAFDNFTIILQDGSSSKQHLIYKHSIANISPDEALEWRNTQNRNE